MSSTKHSPSQIAVLDFARANGGQIADARTMGLDPRALPHAIKALTASGDLMAVGGGFRLAPTDDEQTTVASIVAFCRWLVELPKIVRARCGVVPARWHAMATANGGGCADNIDLAFREAFLTLVTDKSDKPQCDVAALRNWGGEIGLWNTKWEIRNPGMQRMNLVNRVRAAIRKGAEISLNGTLLTTAK